MIGMQSEELIYKKVIVNLHTVIFLKKNWEYNKTTTL